MATSPTSGYAKRMVSSQHLQQAGIRHRERKGVQRKVIRRTGGIGGGDDALRNISVTLVCLQVVVEVRKPRARTIGN